MIPKEATITDGVLVQQEKTPDPSAKDLRTKESVKLGDLNGNDSKDIKLVSTWVRDGAREVLGAELEAELLPQFRRVLNKKVYEGEEALRFVGQSLIAASKGMQWDQWNEGYHGYLSAAAYRNRIEQKIELARKIESGNGGAVTVYTYDPEKFPTLDSRRVTERTPQEDSSTDGLVRSLARINEKMNEHVAQHNLTSPQINALDQIAGVMGKSIKDKQASVARLRTRLSNKKLLA